MDEKRWMDKIRSSAEDLEVPESLKPENVEKMLRGVRQKPERKQSRLSVYSRRLGAVAAAAVVLGLTYQAAELSKIPPEDPKKQFQSETLEQEETGTEAATEKALEGKTNEASRTTAAGDMEALPGMWSDEGALTGKQADRESPTEMEADEEILAGMRSDGESLTGNQTDREDSLEMDVDEEDLAGTQSDEEALTGKPVIREASLEMESGEEDLAGTQSDGEALARMQSDEEASSETQDSVDEEYGAAREGDYLGFIPAGSYDEVFEAIDKWQKENAFTDEDVVYYEMGAATGRMEVASVEDGAQNLSTSGAINSVQTSSQIDMDLAGDTDYSHTNLMELGVDEGDIVKTDGKFLYVLKDSRLSIFRISDNELKEAAHIELLGANGSDRFEEMYVDGERLVLISSGSGTRMVKGSGEEYRMISNYYTVADTYSLADPENPQLLGKVKVDGSYHTSRRNGDFLYLLTDYIPMIETEVSDSVFVPLANGEEFSAEDILLPRELETSVSLVTVSVDLNHPDDTLDRKALVGISDLIYVSEESIYLTQSEWGYGDQSTNIMKFSYEGGVLEGVGAGKVPGYLNDAFSMNEYKGYLRVVTTQWKEENQNGLYVLDDTMKLTGKIEKLAPGEQIYSARFLGDTGYFVTFRNMDPLFSVDLSNPENPELLGELKVTGFSEYLHFWGEDHLLGIGREVDPDTGEEKGVKLSMFDISDPRNVTEENKYVVKGAGLKWGMENYKAVLADAGKNLIGLAVGAAYQAFTYSAEDGFENILDADLTGNSYYARGAYVKDTFYLVDSEEITLYDMKTAFGDSQSYVVCEDGALQPVELEKKFQKIKTMNY